jgi:hypothetical protein
VGIKDAFQQRLAQLPLNLLAALEVPRNHVPPTNHYQGADVRPRKIVEGAREHIDGAAGQASRAPFGKRETPLHPPEPDAFEEVAQVLLEDHDQGHEEDREKTLEQGHGEHEVQLQRDQVKNRHHHHPGEDQARATRSFGRNQEGIDKQRDDHDVAKPLKPNLW